MPRMQVYLPDDLHAYVKENGLPASEMLQNAIRAEMKHQEILRAGKQYLADLIAEIGEPDEATMAWARSALDRIMDEPATRAS